MSNTSRDSLRLCTLETFLAVVDCGGVEARAAEKLGISASQVNRDVERLERWLHRLLFEQGTPKELNEFGDAFAATARTVVAALNAARADSNEPLPKPRAPIYVGDMKMRPRP